MGGAPARVCQAIPLQSELPYWKDVTDSHRAEEAIGVIGHSPMSSAANTEGSAATSEVVAYRGRDPSATAAGTRGL